MLQDQRFWLLISLKLSGEATIEELEELEAILNSNPELLRKAEMLKKLWEPSRQILTQQAEDSFDRHLQRLNSKVFDLAPEETTSEDTDSVSEKSKKRYYKLWWGAVAASVLLFWVFFRDTDNVSQKSVSNVVSTKPGYKASINLPDGSKVWLNADSKLTYDGDFQDDTREVYLSGEAFFDIAKDKNRPFIIHTRTINLKVLGTAFNVRSYDDDKETETALVHGSVEVTLKNNPDKKIVLQPGEKLLVKNTQEDSSAKRKVPEQTDEEEPLAVLTKMHYYGQDSSSVETSWTKNQLVFDKEYLDKIASKIERWYNVKVTIKDEALNEEKYTAIFEDENLEDVLEALKMTGGFHYSVKNREVVISR